MGTCRRADHLRRFAMPGLRLAEVADATRHLPEEPDMGLYVLRRTRSRNQAAGGGSMSRVSLIGNVHWELSRDGVVLRRGESRNLVTQVGDQLYAERGAAIASPPATPTGMKLGTGSTATSKAGAGAALTTYLANSHLAFDATYPKSSLSGSARRITYICTYGPGKATSASPITEAVIVNEALANAT